MDKSCVYPAPFGRLQKERNIFHGWTRCLRECISGGKTQSRKQRKQKNKSYRNAQFNIQIKVVDTCQEDNFIFEKY